MTIKTGFESEPIISFERGIDEGASPTAMPRGSYEHAQNMLMGVDGEEQYLATLSLESELDSGASWPAANAKWTAPFTFSAYASGVLSFTTILLVAFDDGSVRRYDAGSPGTFTLVRRGFPANLTSWFSQATYDKWLLLFNGIDAPMKFGQHFRYGDSDDTSDTQNETAPYMFPIGARPISPLGPSIDDETWTLGTNGSFLNDDGTEATGARVGTQSLRVADQGSSSYADWGVPKDFTAGPKPYGGTAIADTDFLVFQWRRAGGGTSNIRVRFHTTAGVDYFEFTITTVAGENDNTWQRVAVLRSTDVLTGTPNYNSITRVEIFNDDTTNALFVDDMYWLYADAPPAGQVGTAHKGRIVMGGAPVAGNDRVPALTTMFFSRAEFPDEFPGSNVQTLAGSVDSLGQTNQITAMREYGDTLVVGLRNAIVSWTVGTTGSPSRSFVTGDFGIDSQRAFIEVPTGSLIFPWQRGLYTLRVTGREYIGHKVADIIGDAWMDEPWWWIASLDVKTKTVRFWWREKTNGDPTRTTTGLIYDYIRAAAIGEPVYVSEVTELADFAVPAFVNGIREVLYGRFNSSRIFRLHAAASGTITSNVTLPWMATQNRDTLTKWDGVTIPYRSNQAVAVQVRYAQNPQDFETASFTTARSLPANPTASEPGRVTFGQVSRWAQVRLQATAYGFRVYPPISVYRLMTERTP